MYSKTRTFSHVYVEQGVLGHPRARRILGRLKQSEVVVIDHYKNVFNRSRQDFWRQKAGAKLILAAKQDNLLYGGNTFLQGNMSRNFKYNTTVLNCPYDCHYCYLQGMFPGANLVVFVNLEDFFAAAGDGCENRPDPASPMPLAISYESDLLALEGLLGYVETWADWSRKQPDVLIEVRTKSAPHRFLREVEPSSSMRLAWTLSPDAVCRRYESGAPGLEQRLQAMATAAAAGWRLAICLDPVLRLAGWREMYGEFMAELAGRLPWDAVEQVEIGVFRVSSGYFKRMRQRPGTDLLQYPYDHATKAVSYEKNEREDLVNHICQLLPSTLSEQKILLWT